MTSTKNYGDMASRIVESAFRHTQRAGRQTSTTGDLLIAFTQHSRCEAAAFLNSFGVHRQCRDTIEAQIRLSDEINDRTRGISVQLAAVYRAASFMPERFSSAQTTDLQLLLALFCTMHPQDNQIFPLTLHRRAALDALCELSVDIRTIKVKLMIRLAADKRSKPLPKEKSWEYPIVP